MCFVPKLQKFLGHEGERDVFHFERVIIEPSIYIDFV